MSRMVTRVSVGFVLACVCLGCGTTHHFLPPQPLEDGQWQFQLYWHYDIGVRRPAVKSILPEFNAYWGQGHDCTIGFGLQIPFLIQHATICRQFESNLDHSWTWYAHLNGILSRTSNPMLEGGIMYTTGDGDWTNRICIGVGTRVRREWLYVDSAGNHSNGVSWPIIPIVKYAGGGRDVGLSWVHYHGLTLAGYSQLRDAIVFHNDTLAVLMSDDIDSVHWSPNGGWYQDDLVIFVNGDSVMSFDGWQAPPDLFFNEKAAASNWMGYGFGSYTFKGQKAIINGPEIIDAWRQGGHVAITRYPLSLLPRFNPWRSLIDDNSFATGLFFYRNKSSE